MARSKRPRSQVARPPRELEGAGWTLIARLSDPDPEVRSAAAISLGQHPWKHLGLSSNAELLNAIATHDARCPGIADAYWTTYLYSDHSGGTQPEHEEWMLRVLEARRGHSGPRSPVPGNHLEFYAHEVFEANAPALRKLLSWGYVNAVESALDHGELRRDDWIDLAVAIYAETANPAIVEAVAIRYGVIHPDFAARARRIRFLGTEALVVQSEGRRWSSIWLFPHPAPARIEIDDLHGVFRAIEAAGVPFGAVEVPFDPEDVNIPWLRFVDIAGASTVEAAVREDAQLRLALSAEGVVALQIARSRRR